MIWRLSVNNIYVCKKLAFVFCPEIPSSQTIGLLDKDDLLVEIMVISPWVLCLTRFGLSVVHYAALYPREGK